MTLDELLKFWEGQNLFLSGVDKGEFPAGAFYKYDDVSNVLLFVVNDIGYCAVEDPEDGYRSAMRELTRIPAELVKNRFEGVRVTARKGESGTYASEVVELVDAASHRVVLEVGTSDASDYYPCFVATWTPENLSVNQPALDGFRHHDKRKIDDEPRERRGMQLVGAVGTSGSVG